MKYISRKKSEVIRPYHILYHILTTTLHWIIRHNHQIKVLSKVINFVIRPKLQAVLAFQKHLSTGHQKVVGYFTRQNLINAISFFITKCYFTIGNLVLKQEISIPMGIDRVPC